MNYIDILVASHQWQPSRRSENYSLSFTLFGFPSLRAIWFMIFESEERGAITRSYDSVIHTSNVGRKCLNFSYLCFVTSNGLLQRKIREYTAMIFAMNSVKAEEI